VGGAECGSEQHARVEGRRLQRFAGLWSVLTDTPAPILDGGADVPTTEVSTSFRLVTRAAPIAGEPLKLCTPTAPRLCVLTLGVCDGERSKSRDSECRANHDDKEQ